MRNSIAVRSVAVDCYGREVASRAVLIAASLLTSGCIFSRMFYYNIPDLSTPDYFDARTVAPSKTPLTLRVAKAEQALPLNEAEKSKYKSFDELLRANNTKSFLAIRDDEIVYERYFDGITKDTKLPSFSISKTFAALLIGCAMQDGLLGKPDDKLVDYIPELIAKKGYEQITLDHLLRMTSGIDFVEESVEGAMFYYSYDVRSRLYYYKLKHKPGTHYEYASVNIQLLWEALHRRLKGRTVAQYFADRVWTPLGAAHEAQWSLDSAYRGVEKLFGGFNATTRDHARFGLLFLHRGNIAGRQVVPEKWIDESLEPDPVPGIVETTDGFVRRAKYQWFLTLDGRAYFAKGYHGQYIFMVPDKKMVFVRFAEGYGDVDWPSLFVRFADSG
jgi:CubicO group peptidase (beta-lactamase class C family)